MFCRAEIVFYDVKCGHISCWQDKRKVGGNWSGSLCWSELYLYSAALQQLLSTSNHHQPSQKRCEESGRECVCLSSTLSISLSHTQHLTALVQQHHSVTLMHTIINYSWRNSTLGSAIDRDMRCKDEVVKHFLFLNAQIYCGNDKKLIIIAPQILIIRLFRCS